MSTTKKNTKNSAKLPTAKEINNFLDAHIRGHYDADFELVSENDEPLYEEFLDSFFHEKCLEVLQETYRECLQKVDDFKKYGNCQYNDTCCDEDFHEDGLLSMVQEEYYDYLQSSLETARSNLVFFWETELQKIQESGARFRASESWQQLQLLSC